MNKVKSLIAVIKSIMTNSTNQRILNKKLGSSKEGVPYYLYLLNLNFEKNEEETQNSLNKLKKLAIDLKTKPEIIQSLITDKNWRPTLVGNTIVILLGDKKFQRDLIWRLENGSWVAPQLAVGIAMIDNGLAEKELQRIIENASEKSNPKIIMSAFASLKFLKSEFAEHFEGTDLFRILKEKDSWDNSVDIAERHWGFWKSVEPAK